MKYFDIIIIKSIHVDPMFNDTFNTFGLFIRKKNCAHTFIVYDKQNFFWSAFPVRKKKNLETSACLSGYLGQCGGHFLT